MSGQHMCCPLFDKNDYFRRVKVNLDKRFRLKGFDYGANNTYFITINCKNKKPFFGKIEKGEITHSEIGLIVIQNWKEIPEHFSFVLLDEFVCMPDHFHGIIQFNKPDYVIQKEGNSFGPQKDNLGVVISRFKASVTRYANQKGIIFQWHSRYHDSIVSDLSKLEAIRVYIHNNPKNYLKSY